MVPTIVVNFVYFDNFVNSCYVSEVYYEVASSLLTLIGRYIEMGTEALQRAGVLGVTQRAAAAEHNDLVLIPWRHHQQHYTYSR